MPNPGHEAGQGMQAFPVRVTDTDTLDSALGAEPFAFQELRRCVVPCGSHARETTTARMWRQA